MGKKGSNKKSNTFTSTPTTTTINNNNNSNTRSKKVKLMVKNPFTDLAISDSTNKQLDMPTIIATAPLTAAEFAAASQQSQVSLQQRRPDNYNPFSDSHAYLFGTGSDHDEDDGDDGEEDEESVVWARREALAALDPYNVNAYKEHFKSLKVPKQQESQEDLLQQSVLPSSPSQEISTQPKAFEEPDGSLPIIAASTPPTSRRQQQQQQRESFRSSIYSTPKAQIQRRPISCDMTRTSNNSKNRQEDILPEISISLATPSPPPTSSPSSNKRHHRRGSSLVNANLALLTTTFTPSPLSISSPLDEEFDRLEANKNKKDKSNRSTTIYTTLFQRISSFGSFSAGKATANDEELVDHIGAEMKKDFTITSSKPVSTSWSLKRNTFGASSGGVSSSSSLSDLTIQRQSIQASRFGILGRRSNKGSRSNKKSRKRGVAAVMGSLDPWDSCDDMLLQGTDDEDLYDDDGRSSLPADRRDQFLKGRMGGRRRSSDDTTTSVETDRGVIPRLGKGAMAEVEDWMIHPRTAAIRGTIHKVRHDDAVPVPVSAFQYQSEALPVSSFPAEYVTISLASPPMTVYSSQALGSDSNGATISLSREGSFDSSFHRFKKGASNFLGSIGSNPLQSDAKGQAKKNQDQDEDERMRRMMNGDNDGGELNLVSDPCADNIGSGDSDLAFNDGRAGQRSSSMTFGPSTARKAVSPPPLATFSSFPSLRDFIHSATGLSRSSTVPVGGGNGMMDHISSPTLTSTAYLRRSQTTTGGFGGYSEVQQGYSSSSATTGTDSGRASFSPVSRRKNTPAMVPTIVVPKHVLGSGIPAALSATPMSFSPPPLTSASSSSSSTTTTIMTSSDDDPSDYLSMAAIRTAPPTRTFHRLGSTTSLTVPAKAATAANSTQLPSALAAAAMAAAQRARAAYSQSDSDISSSSASLNRSNTSVSVDSLTGPLTGNDYIGQFERDRAQARNFGDAEHKGDPFGSKHRINDSSSFSNSNSNSSGSLNSLATTVQQHQLHKHGSTVFYPTTALSSTTTLLVDGDADSHGRHKAGHAAGVGAGDIEMDTNANRGHGRLGLGFPHRPTSLYISSLPNDDDSNDSISRVHRTRQPSTQSDISEKLMHLPEPSPFEGMCSCRGLVNIASMVLILCGLILLILGYPIASSLKKDRLAAEAAAADAASAANAALSQVRFAIDSQHQQQGAAAAGGGGAGLGLVGPVSKTATSTVIRPAMRLMVDPDTPEDRMTTVASDGELWDLAFSDEFNQDGRGFAPGQDPHWEAVNLPPSKAMGTLENYSSDQVTTRNGHLEITLQRDPVQPSGAKLQKRDGGNGGAGWAYTSGMLQSWNKLCFQGGILEVAVSLPGNPAKAGLKPRVFVLGNLARYGYPASMEGVWPFSSSYSTQCDPAITSTRSNSTTASSSLTQRLNGCSSDADTPLGSMSRGAPEMTLLETHYGVQMDTSAVEAQKRAIQNLQQAPPKVLQRREYHHLKRHQEEPIVDRGVNGAGTKGEAVVLQKQKLGGSRVIVDATHGGVRIGGGGSASRQSIVISSVKLASSFTSSSATTNGSNNSSMIVAVETSSPQWVQPLDTRFFASPSSLSNLQGKNKEEFVKVGLEYWPGILNSTTPIPEVDNDAYIQFSLNNIRHPPLLSNSHSVLHSQLHQSSPLTTTTTRSANMDENWYKDAQSLPENTQIPQEPMSIVVGLGLLQDELLLDPELVFPAVMKVDYIRLYQPRQRGDGEKEEGKSGEWLSCDPVNHPTAAYIRTHPRAYLDPGISTWADTGYTL